jgi:hypothetical protein
MTDDQNRRRQCTDEDGEGKKPGHFRQVPSHENLLLAAMRIVFMSCQQALAEYCRFYLELRRSEVDAKIYPTRNGAGTMPPSVDAGRSHTRGAAVNAA